jgi:branched-chain amino acid transport system permease protein
VLLLEQTLNALQLGLMLFLIAAGLTLVFGIMDLVNLAHGSLYMVGAYLAASLALKVGSFVLALLGAMLGTALLGMLIEMLLLRRVYGRSHLSQVLVTFALILIANETVRWIWGANPIDMSVPPAISGSVQLLPGLAYSEYRLVIIAAGLALAAALFWIVHRTRLGIWIRAGASNRDMARALGVDTGRLFTLVFGLGAALGAFAGGMLGPILSVQVGMGETIIIVAFVVVVIGGIGSVRGALLGALLVAAVDTYGRAFLPGALGAFLPLDIATHLGPGLSQISIFIMMAAILYFRPRGLMPATS